MSIKEDLLSKHTHVVEPLAVEGWGSVHIRTWTAGERSKLYDINRQVEDGKAKTQDFFARAIVYSVCDEDGKSIFSEKDIPRVMDLSVPVVDALMTAINELNTRHAEQKKSN